MPSRGFLIGLCTRIFVGRWDEWDEWALWREKRKGLGLCLVGSWATKEEYRL